MLTASRFLQRGKVSETKLKTCGGEKEKKMCQTTLMVQRALNFSFISVKLPALFLLPT